MNDNLAADHAWSQCKAELEPQKWTIGDHGMFYGFFLNGWSARAAWDSHKASECQRLAHEAGRLRAENERLTVALKTISKIGTGFGQIFDTIKTSKQMRAAVKDALLPNASHQTAP